MRWATTCSRLQDTAAEAPNTIGCDVALNGTASCTPVANNSMTVSPAVCTTSRPTRLSCYIAGGRIARNRLPSPLHPPRCRHVLETGYPVPSRLLPPALLPYVAPLIYAVSVSASMLIISTELQMLFRCFFLKQNCPPLEIRVIFGTWNICPGTF